MKRLLTTLTFFIFSFCAFSQTDPIRTEQDFIFQNIDKTQIPTGYLIEYGPEVVYKKWLNGVLADSNVVADIDIFNFLYNDLENARINNSVAVMLPLDSAKGWVDLARYDSLTQLAIFRGEYATLNEDAITLNLFTAYGNQIFDVPNRSQSPYLLNHSFVAVPVLTESKYKNEIRLGYSPLFYGNSIKTIASVFIDFLDGAGYQTLYANGQISTLTKVYTDSSGFKEFAVKVVYADTSIDECYTGQIVDVEIIAGNNTANRYDTLTPSLLAEPSYKVAPTSYLNVNPKIPILWTSLFPNAPFTQQALRTQRLNQDMKVYIRYSKKRLGTSLANQIVKPFIVVEGYDITDASPLLKATNYDINKLIREWDKDEFLNSFDFNKELDETAGYDLIFIDYYTMRSITENADYLLQAIDWINNNKQSNAAGVREQNVVMGISMGGLVSRFALAKRTKQSGSNSTETKQLITMDSPHQGSNVPLGFQHFLYDFGAARIVKKISKVSDDLQAFYNLNTQISTQQQLILRVTDDDGNIATNTFLAPGGVYRNMVDYASPYPFYAVSNGSQCGRQVMDPGTLLLEKSGNVATANRLLFFWKNKYKLNIQVNSLPTYGSQAQVCSVVMERNIRLFYGLIGTGWQTTSNTPPRISPANTIPWDGVQGGTKSTETTGPINQSSVQPDINIKKYTFLGNVLRSLYFVIWLNVESNIQLPFSQKEFSFVPITSSLDVQNVTASTFNQQYVFPLNGQNGSRATDYLAQDYIGNGVYNIEHTNFTPRNAEWIYKKMENANFTDCAAICPPNDGYSISGPSIICSNSSYTVSGLSSNLIVDWTVQQNSGTVTLATVGNIATLTRIGDGFVTLKATIRVIGCVGNATLPITKQIYIGLPKPVTNLNGQPNISHCHFVSISLLPIGGEGATTFKWYTDYPSNPGFVLRRTGTSTDAQLASLSDCNEGGVMKVDAVNACGVNSGTSYSQQIGGVCYPYDIPDCQFRSTAPAEDSLLLQASPNPATDQITAEIKYTANYKSDTNSSSDLNMQKIIIVNSVGNLVLNISGDNTSKINFNVYKLTAGNYTLSAFNGQRWISCTIIKQ